MWISSCIAHISLQSNKLMVLLYFECGDKPVLIKSQFILLPMEACAVYLSILTYSQTSTVSAVNITVVARLFHLYVSGCKALLKCLQSHLCSVLIISVNFARTRVVAIVSL